TATSVIHAAVRNGPMLRKVSASSTPSSEAGCCARMTSVGAATASATRAAASLSFMARIIRARLLPAVGPASKPTAGPVTKQVPRRYTVVGLLSTMLGSAFAYTGVVLFAAGLALFVRPIAMLGVATRWQAVGVAVSGFALSVASLAAPAFTTRVATPSSRLDAFAPEWQFHEVHTRHMTAPPARVYAALRQVRADEITLFNTLTWIRRFGRPL